MSAKSRLILISVCAGLLIFCLLLPAIADEHLPKEMLNADEVQTLVQGHTAEVNFGKSNEGLLYFGPDGELQRIQDERLTRGTWEVRKNARLCMKFDETSRKCRILVPEGELYRQLVVKKDGNHRLDLTYLKFHQGNRLAKLKKGPLLPEGTLTRKELKRLFSGKTVESQTVNKGRVSLSYYDPSGAVEQIRNGNLRTGSWRVNKNDRICLQMEDSREKCRIVVKEGNIYNKYIVKKNGHHQNSVTYLGFREGKQF